MASQMAVRLKESQKRDLVEGFRLGTPTADLAKSYGCSQNTVIRIVKAFVSKEEYTSLKSARSRGPNIVQSESVSSSIGSQGDSLSARNKSLAFDDLRPLDTEPKDSSEVNRLEDKVEIFHEIIPLSADLKIEDHKEVICKPFSLELLPTCVYLLVDRTVEIVPQSLREFPELGTFSELDQERKVICLFEKQRDAKRNCRGNQRVIKIPNTSIFSISIPFLINRGITRLLMDSSLISID
tara:strand:- start:1125 stop:1841 length:717 start_codon:yes stop_codon:yes gene_type:complete